MQCISDFKRKLDIISNRIHILKIISKVSINDKRKKICNRCIILNCDVIEIDKFSSCLFLICNFISNLSNTSCDVTINTIMLRNLTRVGFNVSAHYTIKSTYTTLIICIKVFIKFTCDTNTSAYTLILHIVKVLDCLECRIVFLFLCCRVRILLENRIHININCCCRGYFIRVIFIIMSLNLNSEHWILEVLFCVCTLD